MSRFSTYIPLKPHKLHNCSQAQDYVPFLSGKSLTPTPAMWPLRPGISLPQDVLYLIALHLYLDWESLQAFSLVGREWRAASRSFVFQNITIDSHFMTLAELQKVLDADSSFGPLIRAVKLSFVEPSLRTQELECWLPYFPEVLCQRLPNVHSLELKCLPRCPFLPQFPQQLSGITSITSLILVNCDFLGGVLVDFASALPQLQDLQIHSHQDVIYDSDMTVIGNTSRPMTQLRSVTYHRPELDAFLEWIGPIIAPTSLGVNVGHPESLSRLGALLRRLGGALQHLELRILYKTWNEDFFKQHIDLSLNTGLKSVCLYGLDKPSTAMILSEINSLELHTVDLSDLDGSPEACVNAHNFVLDIILSGAKFKALKQVNLIYCGKATDSELRKVTRVVFRRLRARKILRMLRSSQHQTGLCCFR